MSTAQPAPSRSSAELLDELSDLLGVELQSVRWDPAPRAHEQGQPRGWWVGFGSRAVYLPSSESLRNPRALRSWLGGALNPYDRPNREVWIEPKPLDQADARRVVRLCHEVVESVATERDPR